MKRVFLLLALALLLTLGTAGASETFYAPGSGKIGDVIPIYANDHYYVFFLNASTAKWCVTETEDFVTFTDYRIIQDFGGTGDIVYANGWYHLYCAWNANGTEIIRHFASRDMVQWSMQRDQIQADESRYYDWAWRDPRIVWSEEEQCWWMLVTSNYREQERYRDGCIALLKSADLKTWTSCDPIYAPGRHDGSFECPDYFKMGDWYYLLYSCASENKRTYYVKSQSPEGPWLIPDVDTFDSFNFYAAKTVSDGENRYLCGWSGQKTGQVFSPAAVARGEDYAGIGYGGEMIVHQLVQKENGDLAVKLPQAIASAFDVALSHTAHAVSGDWVKTEQGYQVDATSNMAILAIDGAQESCMLTFQVTADAKEVGVAVHADRQEIGKGYYFTLDRAYQRLSYKSGARMRGGTGYYMPFETEAERPLPIAPGDTAEITVLMDGDMTVVYVNGEVALTTRNAYPESLGIMLYCYAGTAEFTQIVLRGR